MVHGAYSSWPFIRNPLLILQNVFQEYTIQGKWETRPVPVVLLKYIMLKIIAWVGENGQQLKRSSAWLIYPSWACLSKAHLGFWPWSSSWMKTKNKLRVWGRVRGCSAFSQSYILSPAFQHLTNQHHKLSVWTCKRWDWSSRLVLGAQYCYLCSFLCFVFFSS